MISRFAPGFSLDSHASLYAVLLPCSRAAPCPKRMCAVLPAPCPARAWVRPAQGPAAAFFTRAGPCYREHLRAEREDRRGGGEEMEMVRAGDACGDHLAPPRVATRHATTAADSEPADHKRLAFCRSQSRLSTMGQRAPSAGLWLLLAAWWLCCGLAAGRALQRQEPQIAAPGPCTPTQVSGEAAVPCPSHLTCSGRHGLSAGPAAAPGACHSLSRSHPRAWPACGAPGVTACRCCRRRRPLPAGAHCCDGQPHRDAGGLEDTGRQVSTQHILDQL